MILNIPFIVIESFVFCENQCSETPTLLQGTNKILCIFSYIFISYGQDLVHMTKLYGVVTPKTRIQIYTAMKTSRHPQAHFLP
jgi:hypothetical protein